MQHFQSHHKRCLTCITSKVRRLQHHTASVLEIQSSTGIQCIKQVLFSHRTRLAVQSIILPSPNIHIFTVKLAVKWKRGNKTVEWKTLTRALASCLPVTCVFVMSTCYLCVMSTSYMCVCVMSTCYMYVSDVYLLPMCDVYLLPVCDVYILPVCLCV